MAAVRNLAYIARRFAAVLWTVCLTSSHCEIAHATPQYVGVKVCAGCHAEQAAAWKDSDHARSMQLPNAQSVRGDFNHTSFTHRGITSRFFRRGGGYFVNTEGPDGKLHDYAIAYTFGHFPLQQYLITLDHGKLQALGIAWDARSRESGGQRWYAMYPDVKLRPHETVHWTGRDQNWNFMCAACHSTGLDKRFDLAKNSYATTWAELNVACEACHGPGSLHVQWTKGDRRRGDKKKGLVAALHDSRDVQWRHADAIQHIASPMGSITSARKEADVCFPCHARRQEIGSATPGDAFLDRFVPSLIEPGLYFADGQIDGEVFEYGSFTQSRMYAAGVTCSNCHEPHGLSLRAPGNSLCAQCHQPAFYDRAEHHHHASGSEGAQCMACHMPKRTYMGVDVRRDHGFRVPDPDLANATGSLNACKACHADRNPAWAGQALRDWGMSRQPAFESAFKRASMLAALPPSSLPPSPSTAQRIRQSVGDPEDIVRLGAARALAAFAPADQLQLGALDLIVDSLRSVRIEAARALAGVDASQLEPTQQRALQVATDELIAFEQYNADRPESHVNLALIHARLGKLQEAEADLRTAIRLDMRFIPATLHLADLFRQQGRDADGAVLLEHAIALAPEQAAPLHALALLRIRQGDKPTAVALLRKAVALEPANSQTAYVLVLALLETGAAEEALQVVNAALAATPQDTRLRQMQEIMERKLGH